MTPTAETDADADALARALGPLAPPPEADDPLPVERLLAWHRGALDETEAAALEARLAVDPEARAFLADLGAAPSPFLTRWAESRLAPARRGLVIGAVTLVALAAGVLVFTLSGNAPPPYHTRLLRGAHTELRGAEGPKDGVAIIDDEARLVLAIGPTAPWRRDDPMHCRVYVDDPDGRLVSVRTPCDPGEGGNWFLNTPVVELFADRYGPRTLYFALAYDASGLDALDGHDPPTEGAEGDIRWHVLRFNYRPSEAP